MRGSRRRVLSVWALPLAFSLAFAAVRAYAIRFRPEELGNPAGTHFGRVVAIQGFHVHLFYFGLALVTGVALVALARRRFGVGALAGTGVGLALVVDEVGLVASGFTEYNHPWTWPLAVATGALLFGVAALASALGPRESPAVRPPMGPRAP